MNKAFFDRIWHVRDSVALPDGQSHSEAMTRLEPLFHERGTSYERVGNSLTFGKKGQPAQDKMSVYDHGELVIVTDSNGSRLDYHLVSRAFLYCFLAPLLFLALAQMNIFIGEYEKAAAATERSVDEEADEPVELPQSAIDKWLGAPTPELPDPDKKEEEDDGPSPTPAYVFAGIFVVLYLAGRILEAKLVKRLFRRRLMGIDEGTVSRDGATSSATPAAG